MLKQSDLKAQLLAAFDRVKKLSPPPPVTAPLMGPQVAVELAKAYDDWIKQDSPKAGGALLIVTPGLKSGLVAALAVAPLMQGWTPGLVAYWGPVIWKGPGFTAVPNPTVTTGLSAITAPLAALMVPPPLFQSEETFAGALAAILYSGTIAGVVVTATPDSTGTPAPTPIV